MNQEDLDLLRQHMSPELLAVFAEQYDRLESRLDVVLKQGKQESINAVCQAVGAVGHIIDALREGRPL